MIAVRINLQSNACSDPGGKLNRSDKNISSFVLELKKAISMDEKSATAHNSLGFIYADTETKLNSAVKACETALELAPDNPAYLDSIGWAYFKKGNIKKHN